MDDIAPMSEGVGSDSTPSCPHCRERLAALEARIANLKAENEELRGELKAYEWWDELEEK